MTQAKKGGWPKLVCFTDTGTALIHVSWLLYMGVLQTGWIQSGVSECVCDNDTGNRRWRDGQMVVMVDGLVTVSVTKYCLWLVSVRSHLGTIDS